MSSYTKSTDFASKDALLTGNPSKVIKGTEIDDEYNAIQSAVNSKADTNSPSLTGTPTSITAAASTDTTQIATCAFTQAAIQQTGIIGTAQLATDAVTNAKIATDAVNADSIAANAVGTSEIADSVNLGGNPTTTTQSSGNSSTRIATTAFVQAALQAVYPVGSVYINATSTTNPNNLLGFGTWVEFGSGRVLVSQNTGDSSFNSLEETGGSADATLPSHTHTFSDSFTTDGGGAHSHSLTDPGHHHQITGPNGAFNDNLNPTTGTGNYGGGTPDDSSERYDTYDATTGISIGSVGNHTHTGSVSGTTTSAGSSGTNANLQPYIVVKMWKRTA
jgi:hypothetical protein